MHPVRVKGCRGCRAASDGGEDVGGEVRGDRVPDLLGPNPPGPPNGLSMTPAAWRGSGRGGDEDAGGAI